MNINYNIFVYCAGCDIKQKKKYGYSQRCPECKLVMRRTPRNLIFREKEVKRY